jgi:hypothetical protein
VRYDINAFRIGDYLYSCGTGGAHAYRVIEIRTQEGGKNQLVVEDPSGYHGRKCRLVVHESPTGNLVLTATLDDSDSRDHWCLQDSYDYYLHPTLLKARQERCRRNMAIIKEEIAWLEARLARERATLAQYMEVANAQEPAAAPRG